MVMPSSGPISMAQVAAEIGISATGLSLNDSRVRQLANKPSGAISFSDLWGKSWLLPPVLSTMRYSNGATLGHFMLGHYNNLHFYAVNSGGPAVLSVITDRGATVTSLSGLNVSIRGTNRNGFYTMTFTLSNARGSSSKSYSYEVYDPGGGCCFTADSLVTMHDGSYKRIDEVQVGDLVATPFGYSEVDWIRLPLLAHRPLLAMTGGKCKTSGEHNIWAKDPETGEQWWATRDMERWAYEAEYELGPGLNGNKPTDLIGQGRTSAIYATEDGWKETEWYTVEGAPEDTQLYHLYLKDHASYFVDGFLVIGELPRLETAINWKEFKWDPANPQAPVRMHYDYELKPVDKSAFKRITRVTEIDSSEVIYESFFGRCIRAVRSIGRLWSRKPR